MGLSLNFICPLNLFAQSTNILLTTFVLMFGYLVQLVAFSLILYNFFITIFLFQMTFQITLVKFMKNSVWILIGILFNFINNMKVLTPSHYSHFSLETGQSIFSTILPDNKNNLFLNAILFMATILNPIILQLILLDFLRRCYHLQIYLVSSFPVVLSNSFCCLTALPRISNKV